LVAVFGLSPKTAEASILRKAPNNLGLVGYWSFEDATGTIATDFSGNGNSGTLTNMETTDWVNGKVGKALDFDGSNERVEVGNNFSLQLTSGFSTSAWIKRTSGSNAYQGVYGKYDQDNLAGWFWTFYTDNNKLKFGFRLNGGNYWSASSNTVFVNNVWYHIAFVYLGDGSTPRLWINGAEETSLTTWLVAGDALNGFTDSNTILTIGEEEGFTDTNKYFPGQIDEVRIYNRTLSATEVADLYARTGFARAGGVSKQGLKAYWSFEDGIGNKATDFSGNGHTGALTNMDNSDWISGKSGKALAFAGDNDFITLTYDTDLNFAAPASIGLWVRTTTDSPQALFSVSQGSTANNIFQLVVGDGMTSWLDNEMITIGSIDAGDINNIGYTTTSRNELFDGNWHHIFIVSNGSTWSIYLDGASKTVTVGTSSSNNGWLGVVGSADTIRIANRRVNSTDSLYLNGDLDEVRVYDRALSATEVAAIYAQTKTLHINSSRNNLLTDGLVGLWSFDGADYDGTTAYDRSGNGNNGTKAGNAKPAIGRLGQALSFDGLGDYVDFGDKSDFALTSDYSFSFWMRPSTVAGNTDIFVIGGTSSGNIGNTSAKVRASRLTSSLRVVAGDTVVWVPYSLTLSSFFTANEWVHVVCTVDTAQMLRCYKNGAFVNNLDWSDRAGVPSGNYFTLGIDRNWSAIDFEGQIDEFRIYDRTLSATEILQLYNMGK